MSRLPYFRPILTSCYWFSLHVYKFQLSMTSWSVLTKLNMLQRFFLSLNNDVSQFKPIWAHLDWKRPILSKCRHSRLIGINLEITGMILISCDLIGPNSTCFSQSWYVQKNQDQFGSNSIYLDNWNPIWTSLDRLPKWAYLVSFRHIWTNKEIYCQI